MLLSRIVVSIFAVGLFGVGAGVASGQDYPNKPIRINTGSPGGGNDFNARQIAPALGSQGGCKRAVFEQ